MELHLEKYPSFLEGLGKELFCNRNISTQIKNIHSHNANCASEEGVVFLDDVVVVCAGGGLYSLINKLWVDC